MIYSRVEKKFSSVYSAITKSHNLRESPHLKKDEWAEIDKGMLPNWKSPTRFFYILKMVNCAIYRTYVDSANNRYYYEKSYSKIEKNLEITLNRGLRSSMLSNKLFKRMVRQGVFIEVYQYGTNVKKGSYTDTFRINYEHRLVKKFFKKLGVEVGKYSTFRIQNRIDVEFLRGVQ